MKTVSGSMRKPYPDEKIAQHFEIHRTSVKNHALDRCFKVICFSNESTCFHEIKHFPVRVFCMLLSVDFWGRKFQNKSKHTSTNINATSEHTNFDNSISQKCRNREFLQPFKIHEIWLVAQVENPQLVQVRWQFPYHLAPRRGLEWSWKDGHLLRFG